MGQEGDDRLSLPVPPPPNPAARRAAIDAAMRRFDGIEDTAAPRRRFSLAGWASRHRAAAGGLATAALFAVLAIPAIQVAIRNQPPVAASEDSFSERAPARDLPVADGVAAETAAPEPGQAPTIPQPLPVGAAEPAPVTAERSLSDASGREEEAAVTAPAPVAAAPAPAPIIAPPPPPPPPPPAAEAEAKAQVADVGNIVVSGSRLRRQNLESSSPVAVIDPAGEFLSNLRAALGSNDRRAVMRLVGFPLRVRVGGVTRTYRTAAEVDRDYDRIVTPAVRNAALGLSLDTLLTRDGGRLRGNGRIWIGCGSVDCPSASSIRIREINP